jgi:hypothetical protein
MVFQSVSISGKGLSAPFEPLIKIWKILNLERGANAVKKHKSAEV